MEERKGGAHARDVALRRRERGGYEWAWPGPPLCTLPVARRRICSLRGWLAGGTWWGASLSRKR